jgi:hypothetical protein
MAMTAVRYRWMFRTAAIVFLFFGAVFLWRFGLTDYHPEWRLLGLPTGILVLLLGFFLLRGRRMAIGASAVALAFVGICSAVAAPNAKGPVILFLAGLAIVCVLYAVLATRVLFGGEPR